jgi:hypothetical protein
MAEQHHPSVTLIGAGGIGAVAAIQLAKYPFGRITIWDHDVVGDENLINQLFFDAHVGTNKAEAIAAWLRKVGTKALARPERYTGSPCFDSIVISAVDSIQERRVIWQGIMKGGARNALFLDGRLSRETPLFAQLFAIQLDNDYHRRCYEEWLEGDGEPDTKRRDPDMIPAPFVLAGAMGTIMVQWLRGKRDLPWQATYYGEGMMLTSNFEDEEKQ